MTKKEARTYAIFTSNRVANPINIPIKVASP
jgi:hypothetical protein